MIYLDLYQALKRTTSLRGTGTMKPFRSLHKSAELYHGRTPYLRKIPLAALGLIGLIALINALVWAAVGVVLVRKVSLASHCGFGPRMIYPSKGRRGG